MLGLQHVVTLDISLQHIAVAPPRGVRGLKYGYGRKHNHDGCRTPRGVHGLKSLVALLICPRALSHPSWGA